jgi:asparagine synthase (glutamine-hydrolysing)
VNDQVLWQMTEVMSRRGPDDQGTFNNGMVGLGSRRLSIIDLAGGHQPIANEDESVWIVFNGEIYNYCELRTYLLKRGHQFRTLTDTEVILHLHEEFGPASVEYLNGIFAYAIVDLKQRRLTLARDRMGTKPLYYTFVDDALVFGSELKVLLAHPGVPRQIDLVALNEYLSYEYVPTPRTILQNVFRLKPGHILQFDANGIQTQPYWNLSLARSEMQPPVDWRDYSTQLYDVLYRSVRMERVSDVPIGVLLSGGIDSSAITALMANLSQDVNTFSISFEDSSFDERHFARTVADRFGTHHHELTLTSKEATKLTTSIMDFLDEPFADSSLIPTFLLSKFAREHVKVVLGGDGGDELFGGYPTLKAHRLIESYERLVPWHARAYIAPRILNAMPVSFNNISVDFRLRRFLAGRGVPLQTRHHIWLGSFGDEQKAKLLQGWIKPVLRDTYAQAYEHALECDARQSLNQILYDDTKMYLEGDILYKVDRASMAASLEVRVPLLNRDVVEFVSALPLSLKLHRLTGKFLFKKSMQGLLPNEIINRPKKGFNMPVARWFNGELRDLLVDMLSETRLTKQDFFCAEYVKTLMDEHFTQKRDRRKELWTLLMFQLWYQRYIER